MRIVTIHDSTREQAVHPATYPAAALPTCACSHHETGPSGPRWSGHSYTTKAKVLFGGISTMSQGRQRFLPTPCPLHLCLVCPHCEGVCKLEMGRGLARNRWHMPRSSFLTVRHQAGTSGHRARALRADV